MSTSQPSATANFCDFSGDAGLTLQQQLDLLQYQTEQLKTVVRGYCKEGIELHNGYFGRSRIPGCFERILGAVDATGSPEIKALTTKESTMVELQLDVNTLTTTIIIREGEAALAPEELQDLIRKLTKIEAATQCLR